MARPRIHNQRQTTPAQQPFTPAIWTDVKGFLLPANAHEDGQPI